MIRFGKQLKTKDLINIYSSIRSSLIHKLRHDLDIRVSTLSDLCELLQCKIEDIVELKEE